MKNYKNHVINLTKQYISELINHKADQSVETLNKQIAAIKNLTIPQLPQDVIAAYKAYLADDSDANKNALNDIIQKWFKDSKYDFGTGIVEYSPEHQNVYIKEWSNKDIVLPIDDSVVDLDNLTDKQIEALSQYYALLANNLQDQVWGSHHYIVTEESVQGVKNIAKAYAEENKPYSTSHSDTALAKDGLDSIVWTGENMSYDNTLLGYGAYYSEAKETRKATMSQVFNDKVDHRMISLNLASEKIIPENTSNERAYSYAGNQAKYAANRALPNTGSIENWLVVAMGIVLCSFGISVSRKHRD